MYPQMKALFVGDYPGNDVKASQDVGMLAVWKKDSKWKDVDADFIVHDLMEIPIVVESHNKKRRALAFTRLPNRNS